MAIFFSVVLCGLVFAIGEIIYDMITDTIIP